MQQKLLKFCALSFGTLLLITAVAKLLSALGSAPILTYPAPLLLVSYRSVFLIVGTLELVVALNCFFSQRMVLKMALVAWLASNFLLYRLGLMWVGYRKLCPCLGQVTDALHISPETADTVMKIILLYLLIGSYAALLWLRRQKWQIPQTTAPDEAPVSPK
jgi:hypothetical protein